MVRGEKYKENALLSAALHVQCSMDEQPWDEAWMEQGVACSEDMHLLVH